MVALKKLIGIGGVAAACSAFAAGDTSDPVFAFVQTEQSSLWRTATGRTMTLPIDYPYGASSATLVVCGTKYRREYAVSGDTFVLELPEAKDDSGEDVYELTLTFDDGTVQSARLGLIAGLADGCEGYARCMMDTSDAKWQRAYRHGVLPVPSDATELTVNGVAVSDGDKGFTGAQGWYALPNLAVGALVPVSLTADGVTYDVSLNILSREGTAIFLR